MHKKINLKKLLNKEKEIDTKLDSKTKAFLNIIKKMHQKEKTKSPTSS